MVKRNERLDIIVKNFGYGVINLTKIEKEIGSLRDPNDIIYVGNEIWKRIFEKKLKCNVKAVSFLRDVVYEANEVARDLSTKDHLTGLFNRRFLDSELKIQLASTFRNLKEPFSVIMFDIDHFKAFNDTYGHNAGDVVLRKLSGVVLKSVRDSDVAFRYGGEEFIILLPNTDKADALEVAYRLNSKVANASVTFVDEKGRKHKKPVTVSVGVVEINKKNPVWLLYGLRGRKLVFDYVRGNPASNSVLDNYIKKYSTNRSFGKGEKLTREDIRKRVKELGEFVKSYFVEHNIKMSEGSIRGCAMSWVINEVDSLAYYAKECGRNRVAYVGNEGVKIIEKSK
ncbi:GGDEF domain-containing protein [Candidatus Pacearchaeota archaeon]|nr:GGDEF domain-containing protein [Candidatus Pacearchaeota archaeon]